MSSRTIIRSSAVFAGIAVLVPLVWAAPASAKVIQVDRFGGSFTEPVNVDEECERAYGDFQVTTDVSGTVRIVQRGPGGPEVFSMNRRFRTTWTNSAGQTLLTERGTLLDKDLQWIDNGDGTGTLIVLLTGGYIAKGSNGVIAADPGQTRLALTFDANGDLIDEQVVKGSTGRNDDSSLCDKLAAAFG